MTIGLFSGDNGLFTTHSPPGPLWIAPELEPEPEPEPEPVTGL